MSGQSERMMLASASLLADSARSLEHVAERLESIAEVQASAIDRLVDRLDSLGKGGSSSKAAGVGESALGGFTKGFKSLTDSLMSLGESGGKIKEGFKSLTEGIKYLSKSLVLYSKVPKESVDNLTSFLKDIAKQFDDVDFKKIHDGGEALKEISKGIAVFGLALAASSVVYAIAAVGSLIIVPMIAGYAYLFHLLGKSGKDIQEGAKSIGWMGLALVGFALGIFAVRELAGGDWGEFAKGSLIVLSGIALFSAAFYLVGQFSSSIIKGSEALILSGLAMASIALGIASFEFFKVDMDKVLVAGAAIALTGLAFAIIGKFAAQVGEGALVLFIAGASLAVLALGLASFKLLGMSLEEMLNVGLIVAAVGTAFAGIGFAAPFILAGAASILVVGVSLIALSGGLALMDMVYKKAMDGLMAPSTMDPSKTNLDALITGITDAFFINPVKSLAMIMGAGALVVSAAAMIVLSGGLLLFNYMYGKTTSTGLFNASKSDPERSNFEYMMDSIIDGLVMGPIDLAGLLLAVPAWILAGGALISIGLGVSRFAEIVQKNIDVSKIGDMIKTVLTSVIDVFVGVGSGAYVDWDDVEDGIDAVSGVGNILRGMAEGVARMADLKFPMYDKKGNITGYFTVADKQFDQVTSNMKLIINAIAGTLTEIGASQGDTGWFSKTNAEKGADAIRGVGADLVGLADFVQKAASLTFPIYKDGKEVGKTTITQEQLGEKGVVRMNIISMIKSVTSALADVGSGKAAQSGWFSDSDIEKGKKAITGVFQDLNGIAQMVQSVAQVQDFDKVEANIKRTLVFLPQAMIEAASAISKNKVQLDGAAKFFERMAATADPIQMLANSFDRIVKTMDKFAASFRKMNTDTIKTFDVFIKSLVVFSKVDPNAFEKTSDKGQALLNYVFERGSKKDNTPATPPAPSNAITSTPGNKPLPPAKVDKGPTAAQIQQMSNQQLLEIMGSLNESMSQMAGVLKRIEGALNGTLRVQQI